MSGLDCIGDRCNAAVGLDEYGTASYLGAHLPLTSTEIAVPASPLPIDIQVTPSPPSGSIILLLRQGATISAQGTSNASIGDGLNSPKQSKAELKVGAIWLGRARREASRLLVNGIRGRVASHCTVIASHRAELQCSAVQCNSFTERLLLWTRGTGRRNPVLAARAPSCLIETTRSNHHQQGPRHRGESSSHLHVGIGSADPASHQDSSNTARQSRKAS